MDETPEAGDLREAEAANAPLAASRKEAWLAECLAKTMQFQQMVVQLHKVEKPLLTVRNVCSVTDSCSWYG